VTVIVLTILLAASLAVVVVLALVARHRERRLHEAEDAVVAMARSWSEDGSSRGRLCAAAQLVAGADAAFLAEPTPRNDALRITAAAGLTDLVGNEVPIDPRQSALARTLVGDSGLHVAHAHEFPPVSRKLFERVGVRSAHLRPVLRGDRPVGVLGLAWRSQKPGLSALQSELVVELAGEASRAIERDAHVALLARQARTDELTALPNRRAWDEAVEREMARAERSGEPLCLALLDLDHFKAFNDLHGHQAGDAHLRRTAAAWRRELRTIDVLARYGGEEFGVLLPSCDLHEAREVVDRVRCATPGGETASAGVVEYDGRESAESLLARADNALYRAKHAGRATTVRA
jgi:diguanylate cyclase (GGDEF)-like protein